MGTAALGCPTTAAEAVGPAAQGQPRRCHMKSNFDPAHLQLDQHSRHHRRRRSHPRHRGTPQRRQVHALQPHRRIAPRHRRRRARHHPRPPLRRRRMGGPQTPHRRHRRHYARRQRSDPLGNFPPGPRRLRRSRRHHHGRRRTHRTRRPRPRTRPPAAQSQPPALPRRQQSRQRKAIVPDRRLPPPGHPARCSRSPPNTAAASTICSTQ